MSTHFILIRALSRSARQISSWLSFSRGEFEKNHMSSMYLFGTTHNRPFPEKVMIQVEIPVGLQVFFLPLSPPLL